MTPRPAYLLDTSAAVPLLVSTHPAHRDVATWARGRALGLSGHALVETYAVLTRLPGSARLASSDAVQLIDDNFEQCVALPPEWAIAAHRELARLSIAGGATYDGLVALAAREAGAILVTRDARARATYDMVGVAVEVLRDSSPPRR